jgi:hypothetical protein
MKRALMLIAAPLFVFALFAIAAPSDAQAQRGGSFGVVVGNPGVYGYPSPYYNYYPPVVVQPSYYYAVPPNYSVYNTYYPPIYKTHPRSLYGLPYSYRPLRAFPY